MRLLPRGAGLRAVAPCPAACHAHSTPAPQEARLIDETIRRVDTYGTHQVLYDFNERRQIESRGTEAVLNAVILTSADKARHLREPSASMKKALSRLWETQRADGRWGWLEFGLEPWETTEAAFHGATFAAFAAGMAPGQHDADARAGINLLRTYLSTNYPSQHLYNRTWAQLASTRLKGVVTGLVVYTLKQAGVSSHDAVIRKGLRWLETNQRPSPLPDVPGRAWLAHSLNYDREHGGEKGEPWRRLFMTDTATAFAILALGD